MTAEILDASSHVLPTRQVQTAAAAAMISAVMVSDPGKWSSGDS